MLWKVTCSIFKPHMKGGGGTFIAIRRNQYFSSQKWDMSKQVWPDNLTSNSREMICNSALHYASELLVSTDFPLKTFCKFAQHAAGTNTKKKNVWEKSDDAYSLLIRVQTSWNLISISFYPNINIKENVSFRARAGKVTAWHKCANCAIQWTKSYFQYSRNWL